MHCQYCGSEIQGNSNFCTSCGRKLVPDGMNNQIPQNNGMNNPVQPQQMQQSYREAPRKRKKKNPMLTIALIIGIVIVVLIGLAVGYYYYALSTADQMVCASTTGNITILYKDNFIVGYTAKGFTYDLEGQREYAKQVGMSKYLKEFNNWFQTNTDGVCTYGGGALPPTTPSNIETKTVGKEKYGYVDIPTNWGDFQDIVPNNTIQFSYGTTYIVTLDYVENSEYNVKDLAAAFMYQQQNNPDVTDVNGATVTIGNNNQYTAYQVYMLYPAQNKYVVTYWLEAEDGSIHYLAIEGPEQAENLYLKDLLFIPESFRLTQE